MAHLVSGGSLGKYWIHGLVMDYFGSGVSLELDHLISTKSRIIGGSLEKWWITLEMVNHLTSGYLLDNG